MTFERCARRSNFGLAGGNRKQTIPCERWPAGRPQLERLGIDRGAVVVPSLSLLGPGHPSVSNRLTHRPSISHGWPTTFVQWPQLRAGHPPKQVSRFARASAAVRGKVPSAALEEINCSIRARCSSGVILFGHFRRGGFADKIGTPPYTTLFVTTRARVHFASAELE
jgi:hypothetical protein